MNFASILAFFSTPTGATFLEGIGKGIVTIAQHNKEHLGAAAGPIEAGGAALEAGAGPAGAVEAGALAAL